MGPVSWTYPAELVTFLWTAYGTEAHIISHLVLPQGLWKGRLISDCKYEHI